MDGGRDTHSEGCGLTSANYSRFSLRVNFPKFVNYFYIKYKILHDTTFKFLQMLNLNFIT